jgi:hypothetical protein
MSSGSIEGRPISRRARPHADPTADRKLPKVISPGVEDLVIVPLVVIALAVSKLLKAVLSILIYVLDYAFPILLQLMRIPLLAARLIGDGMELFFEGVVRCLPVLSQPIRQRQATRRIIPLAVRRV